MSIGNWWWKPHVPAYHNPSSSLLCASFSYTHYYHILNIPPKHKNNFFFIKKKKRKNSNKIKVRLMLFHTGDLHLYLPVMCKTPRRPEFVGSASVLTFFLFFGEVMLQVMKSKHGTARSLGKWENHDAWLLSILERTRLAPGPRQPEKLSARLPLLICWIKKRGEKREKRRRRER